MKIRDKDVKRFWKKVNIKDDSLCWEWIAGRYPFGYGMFWINGSTVGAHRVSWEITYGEIPDGMLICHKCDNPCCVNPSHLFLGTYRDNTKDMITKGRGRDEWRYEDYLRGEKCSWSKLTKEEVLEIRRSYIKGKRGHGIRILSKKYGVAMYTIYEVVNNITWKHIKEN